MLPLKAEKGKLYVGKLEVKAEPVYLGLQIAMKFEGKPPALDQFILDIVTDSYSKGLDLFEANAYRLFIVGQRIEPGMSVPDGRVPERVDRQIEVDFYKVHPINQISKEDPKR